MPVLFGIDNLLMNLPSWKNESIAILTNDAAKTNTGILSRTALLHAGFNITKLFSPEHGMDTKGADGEKIENTIDPITKIPIISLYGNKFMPTASELKDVSILVFDIPDAGTRFYTYLWSMSYWIEIAAKLEKKVIILDRPNPLGGNLNLVEGPMLANAVSSFIGRFNIPIRHQLTLGELAQYLNSSMQWNAALEIIPCIDLQRNHLFIDWQLPWVKPSPALQSFEACTLYPGLCFFEATNISIGRGTNNSFEWLGASWLAIEATIEIANELLGEELKFQSMTQTIPFNGVNKEIQGIKMNCLDPKTYAPVMSGLLLLKIIKELHPAYFKWMPYPTIANPSGENHLSLLLGIPEAENVFELPLTEWLQAMTKAIKAGQWEREINPYLLYSK